jgi:cellulose synthase/poly-beta-1,6-N-acetylglucosamine synthase-like glycosyltransferase
VLETISLIVFLILTLVPGLYGIHLAGLAVLAQVRRRRVSREQLALVKRYRAETPDEAWPIVTTQLPLYNELTVARRVMFAAAAMEYPKDRHEIQVLDDSTDETREIVDEAAADLRRAGHDVKVVRRPTRKDYKAGALAYATPQARGEFLAVFDADFVPDKGFLRRMVPLLDVTPNACCVQGRWGHLNTRESWITQSLALAIDGHFSIEQTARCWNGFCLNFNGTGGIWRRAAIEDPRVGGWSGDTITEDLDLSYRAQMNGWKIIYNLDEVCPAEIPATVDAMKTQQRRWATGSIQCARKLLPTVWRCPRLTFLQKLEASVHLTQYSISVFMILMAATGRLLLGNIPRDTQIEWLMWTWILLPFLFAAPSLSYIYGRWAIGGGWSGLKQVPKLIVLGLGLSVNNAYAVVLGLVQKGGEFIRTPKSGSSGKRVAPAKAYSAIKSKLWLFEILLGVGCLAQWVLFLRDDGYIGGTYMLLYGVGLTALGWGSRPWKQETVPTVSTETAVGTVESSPSGVAA